MGAGHVKGHVAAADDVTVCPRINLLMEPLGLENIQSAVDLLEGSTGQIHELLAHAGADGHQHRVVVLFQLRRIGDGAVADQLDAGIHDDLDLVQHVLGGNAVLGHTGGSYGRRRSSWPQTPSHRGRSG